MKRNCNNRDSNPPAPDPIQRGSSEQQQPSEERRIKSEELRLEQYNSLDDVDLDAPIESLWPTSDLGFFEEEDQEEDDNIDLDGRRSWRSEPPACNNNINSCNDVNSSAAISSVDDDVRRRPTMSFDDFIALSEVVDPAHVTAVFRIAPAYTFDDVDFSFSPPASVNSPSSSSSTSAACSSPNSTVLPQPPQWHTRELPFIQKVFTDSLEAHPEAMFRGDRGRDPRNRSGLGARCSTKRPKLQLQRSSIRHPAAPSVCIPPGVAGSGFVRSVTQSCQ